MVVPTTLNRSKCAPTIIKRTDHGFTLIELLVVLAIVALLLTLALPRYFQHIDQAKTAVLIENLRTTRQAIDQFYGDRGRYPESLDELVAQRYLRGPVMDPILQRADSWVLIAPPLPAEGSVYDLKSGAPGADRNGRAYADF